MPHPLELKIAIIRSRVRRLVTLYGLAWVAASVLAAVIVLGLADYLVRFQDAGLRMICSLAVMGTFGYASYRYLYRPLSAPLGTLDLALRLQRRFPALEDRLVSSVEFLGQAEDDPIAGSASLRRAVVAQTTAETERLDFADVLDRRPAFRAVMAGVTVALVAAILLTLDPTASRIAMARLANPLAQTAWPQKNHLRLQKVVERVARGQAFEVEVRDAAGAKLPGAVRVHYRTGAQGNAPGEETELMRPSGADAMVARRENVAYPFSYRIEGGDDQSMPWIDVDVVEPPEIDAVSIRLTPPAYTGWPPATAQGHLRALAGTRVQVGARSTKPLRAAVLLLEGGREIPARVSDDGRQVTVPAPGEPPWILDRSGTYWFALTDREGIVGGEASRWEIHVLPDAPPTVAIERPTETLMVTSRATVPLRVTAKDDLALGGMALVFAAVKPAAQNAAPPEPPTPGEADAQKALPPEENVLPPEQVVVSLYEGPPRVEPQPAGGPSGGGDSGDRRVVEYSWDLAPLELTPGTQLTFHATATDYMPQTGASEPRRLIVITPEELQDRIANQQSQILAEIARVLQMQRDGRAQVQSLAIRLDATGRFEQVDVDHLQAAELNQRQVQRALSSRSEGVPMQILSLLANLENNRVDSPDVRRRMQGLLDEIDRLDREHLPVIGRELTAAIKATQVELERANASPQPAASRESIAASLSQSVQHQDQVIAALQQMLAGLAQWDNYRRFHREIGQLLRDQKELTGRSMEVGRNTLTKELKDLRPQELADLRILAGQQLELAQRLDTIQQEMAAAPEQLRESDPLAAETVADALAETRRLAISGQMRGSGDQLGSNQVGQSIAQQKQIAEDLQSVLDILANRRQHELVRLVKKLEEAERDLAELQRQQAELQRQFQQQSQRADDAPRRAELQRLARQQQQLQEQTEQMGRRLQRLMAKQAGQTAGDAARQMAQAGQSAAGGDCQGAGNRAGEAAKTLQQARDQLAQRRQQAQVELAVEQLARLEDSLNYLRRQQQQALEETRRYEGLRTAGQLTRAQTAGLSDLGRLQRSLQEETAQLGEKLVGAGAFQLTLSSAARYMDRAAVLLDRRQTDAATQQAQQDAAGRLALVLEALKADTPEAAPPDDNAGAGGGAGGNGAGGRPSGNAVQMLAELKLLKLLQTEINLRTAQLQQAAAAAGGRTEGQQAEYASLGEEQGRLADLVLQLLQAQTAAPEDDLDSPQPQDGPQGPQPREERP